MLGGSLTLLRTFDFGLFFKYKRISGFRLYENLQNLIFYFKKYIFITITISSFLSFWKCFLIKLAILINHWAGFFFFFLGEEMVFWDTS